MSTTATSTSAVAQIKKAPKPLILSAPPEQFSVERAEDMLDLMERVRAQNIAAAKPGSIDMVYRYLKFAPLKGVAVRRTFMGWTARPLVDFNTKEPVCDEATGEQMYGPAIVLFNHEEECMEVNQAFDILKTIHEQQPPKGQMLEITYKGLEPTQGGRNKQTFKIIFLKDEA